MLASQIDVVQHAHQSIDHRSNPRFLLLGDFRLGTFGVVAVLLLEVIQIRPCPRQVVLGLIQFLVQSRDTVLLCLRQLGGQFIRFARGGFVARLSRPPAS